MRGDNGDMMQGNWIAAVSPTSKAISEGVVAMPAAKKVDPVANGTARYDDDEITFCYDLRITWAAVMAAHSIERE